MTDQLGPRRPQPSAANRAGPILHRAADTRAVRPTPGTTPERNSPFIDWCGRRHPVELIMMATTFAAIILAIVAGV